MGCFTFARYLVLPFPSPSQAVDYLEVLPREVQHMWYSQFSVPKALFFALRYYTFVHMGLSSRCECRGT
jgi:hypothetical protein